MIYNKQVIKTITLGVHDFILAVLKQEINVHRYKLRSKVQDHDFMSHWKFGSNLLLGTNLLSSTKQWVCIIEGPVQSLKGIVQPDAHPRSGRVYRSTESFLPGAIMCIVCMAIGNTNNYWKELIIFQRYSTFYRNF